jgi:hypothetical protein
MVTDPINPKRMTNNYILDENKIPREEPDINKWAEFFKTENRIVQQTHLNGYFISTVFLGIDHNFLGEPPILFETMIFKEDTNLDLYQTRCATYQQALVMHQDAVDYVNKEGKGGLDANQGT